MPVSTAPYADIFGSLIPFGPRYLQPEIQQKSHPSQWEQTRTHQIPTPGSPTLQNRTIKDQTARRQKHHRKAAIPRSTPSATSSNNSTSLNSEALKHNVATIHQVIAHSRTHRLCIQPACPVKIPHPEDHPPTPAPAPGSPQSRSPLDILNTQDRITASETTFTESRLYKLSRTWMRMPEYKRDEADKKSLKAAEIPVGE